MSIIRREEYVDVSDLSEEAQEAYRDFASECGVANGERWPFEVGEHGDDSVVASYVGQDRTDLISGSLRSHGLAQGQVINLAYEW